MCLIKPWKEPNTKIMSKTQQTGKLTINEGKSLADNIKQATWQREFKHVPESTLSFFLPSPSAWPLNLCVIASSCGTSHTMTFGFLLCITYFYRVWHWAAGTVNWVLLGGYWLEVWVEKRQERAKAKERRKQNFLALLDLGEHLLFFFS